MLTVGQLARRFGLSRSTLLYYDSIGLLSPSERSPANYRLYSRADVERMERIDLYRKAGLPLADIARILRAGGGERRRALEARLGALHREIGALRRQQRVVLALLKSAGRLARTRYLDKERWVAILRATGMSEDDMRRWHVEFERSSPDAHRDFLESLGIAESEIERIRRWSASRVENTE